MVVLATLLVQCKGGGGFEVFVDLKTDYVPEQEFVRVRTELTEDGVGLVRREDFTATSGSDFVGGTRIAELGGVPAGQHTILVQLVDFGGRVLSERLSRVSVDDDLALTVLITRSCESVSCPLSPGDPETTCSGGRCVSPDCTELDPSACPDPECLADADCPAPTVDCAFARCDDDVCFFRGRDDMCPPDQWCQPERGCLPRVGADAGPIMDGGPDALDVGVDAPGCTGGCDDSNACTLDQCVGSTCSNMPVPDGTGCGASGEVCIAGTCGCADEGALDGCNGVDEDCDGSIDEDCGCASGEVVLNVVDTLGNTGTETSVAVDVAGGVHVSYRDGSNSDLRYAYHPPVGFWRSEDVETTGSVGEEVAAAVDSEGGLHVVHHDDTNQDLRYAYLPPGGTWQVVAIDTENNVGNEPSIAIDAADGVHVGYFSATGSDFKYAYRPAGGMWSTEVAVTTNNVGQDNAIAVAADGTVHASFYDANATSLIYVSRSPDGTWSAPETIDEAGNVGEATSIALDDAGGVHISYHYGSSRDLRYAYRAPMASSFLTQDVSTGDDAGRSTALAIAPDGSVHIVYQGGSTDLAHASLDAPGGTWSTEVIETNGQQGLEVSLWIDETGGLHVSHHDNSNQDLRYAYRPDGGAWLVEPIDASGDVGRWSAVAVSSSGTVHVAYHRDTGGVLAHAWKPAGGVWRAQTLVNENNTGRYSALALAPDSTPVIAYFDDSNNELELIERVGGAWVSTVVDTDGSVGIEPSITIAAGEVWIAYRDFGTNDLKVAMRPVGGTFTTMTLEESGDQGRYSALGTDAEGGVHLAWYDNGAQDLRYAYRPAGGSFGSAVAIATSGRVGEHVAMDVDTTGVHLAFQDGNDLGYAFQSPGGLWTLERPIVGGTVGEYAAIAVDGSGTVHVSAWSNTVVGTIVERDLVYAVQPAGGSFTSSILERANDVGEHGSAASGPGDYVYVTYWDRTHNDLKIARICPR